LELTPKAAEITPKVMEITPKPMEIEIERPESLSLLGRKP
jgi:hypothetical protein